MAEVFAPLLEKLAEYALVQLLEHIALIRDVKTMVKELSTNFTAIKKMLSDVEKRRMREEDEAVDVWLGELEELAYEMDDLVDEWITENAKLQLEASQNASNSKNIWEKVIPYLQPIFFCCKEVSMRHDIALKIRDNAKKLDRILSEAKKFEFITTEQGNSSKSKENKSPLVISIFDESEVCGRQSEVRNIISKLIMPRRNIKDKQIPVVSIVGVGGLGKTTLAKKVLHDHQVKEHFDPIIWVTVSKHFDEKRIAKAILQDLGTVDLIDEPVKLFNCIRESLESKKFLLILDDVWTEEYSEWTPFRDTLMYGASESRILLTTRNARVSKTLGSSDTDIVSLSPLKDDDSWLILSRNAFSQGSMALKVREKVQDVGWKIAVKCQGLPLAASFMGNLLKFKYTVPQWEEILDSEIWLKKASEGVFTHLYVSYNDLDPEMKRCFSYCSVFPKSSRIVVEELIRIWIAQGFLGSTGNPKKLESRGRECFDKLAMRSFFQDFERDSDDENLITTCKIHDIVHVFAASLTEKECFAKDQGTTLCPDKVRHMRWMPVGGELNLPITDCRKLRSLFCSTCVPEQLFTSLNSIRLLSLSDCGLQQLPKDVGKFLHLRYLNLRHNPLTELPEAISYLYNLETLDINSCRSLIQLPPKFGNLVNLRCLANYQTESLRQFPQGFEKLTSLVTLSELKVGQGYNKLGCIECLNQLLGSLEIVFVLSGDVESDAVYAEKGKLRNKKNIKKLTLRFQNSNTNADVIEDLKPPPNLENLTLQGYKGTNLPSWIVTSLNFLAVLDIRNSNVPSLPALGMLPSLEILSIYGSGLKFLGCDFLGTKEPSSSSSSSSQVAFRSLKKLSFECMDDWETWEDIREEEANSMNLMPCLKELNLYKCNRLKALPHYILRNISSNSFTLSLKVCIFLLVRYSKLLGDDWNELSCIPKVVKDFD